MHGETVKFASAFMFSETINPLKHNGKWLYHMIKHN
jgi:hypothetical protein